MYIVAELTDVCDPGFAETKTRERDESERVSAEKTGNVDDDVGDGQRRK